ENKFKLVLRKSNNMKLFIYLVFYVTWVHIPSIESLRNQPINLALQYRRHFVVIEFLFKLPSGVILNESFPKLLSVVFLKNFMIFLTFRVILMNVIAEVNLIVSYRISVNVCKFQYF
ncbi:hypothetical protein L9F63_023036, partial [Diploptera punctata]